MSYENAMINDLLPIQLIANIYIITCILFSIMCQPRPVETPTNSSGSFFESSKDSLERPADSNGPLGAEFDDPLLW